MKNTLLILSAFSLLACVDVGKETGEDSGETEIIEYVDPTTTVTWGSSSVDLAITNGDAAATYNWGLTENSGSCLTEGWCWTGEDCSRGYTTQDGSLIDYCHPVAVTGGSLAYGATCLGDAGCDVVEGSTTVFNDSFSAKITHILDNEASMEAGSCWTWGADASYYDGYEKTCNEM